MLHVHVQKNDLSILIQQSCTCMGLLKGFKNDLSLPILEYATSSFSRLCFGTHKYTKFNLACMKHIFCTLILSQTDIESFELESKKR